MPNSPESLPAEAMIPPRHSGRKVWQNVLKWLLFVLVLIFAGRYGYRQLAQADFSSLKITYRWLFLAGLVYFLSWIPAAYIWWKLLLAAGQQAPFKGAFRAHFCGHLGKYVPGKAMALVIRAGLLRGYPVKLTIAGLLATIETLLTMANGMLILIVLLPLLLGQGNTQQLVQLLPMLQPVVSWSYTTQLTVALLLTATALLLTPLFAYLLGRLVNRLSWRISQLEAFSKSGTSSEPVKIRLPGWLVLRLTGWSVLGWVLNGLSLGCVLAGMGLFPTSSWDLMLWTAAVAGGTAIGFLVLFAPGGLGVREAALVAILQLSPEIDASLAIMAALLLRIVSFLSELVFAGLLYVWPLQKPAVTLSSSATGDSPSPMTNIQAESPPG